MKRVVFALATFAVLCSAVFGDIWYVDKDNAGNETGASWGTAYTAIQAGINAAFNDGGGEVWVAEGVYDEMRTSMMHDPPVNTGSVIMKENVHIYGGFEGTETAREQRDWETNVTVIDGSTARAGGPAYHVVVGANNATIDGFTITGGNANGTTGRTGLGGGMFNNSSSPTVANCTFSGNSASDDGGAMGNIALSSPTLDNCTFSGNSAGDDGGAIDNDESSPILTDCSFTANSATLDGGAMNNSDGSSPTLVNCTFVDNTAGDDGGVMRNVSSSPTFTNCTFSGNIAGDDGGALANRDSSAPTLTGCAFTTNSAGDDGGAIRNSSSSPTLADCTFTANSAADCGGAIRNASSSPTVTDCAFTANSADQSGGAIHNDASSPVLTECTFTNNSAEQGAGGGIYNGNISSPTVTNCSFTNNLTGGYGGGMHNLNSSSPTVTNCTFSGNLADGSGGGMYNDSSAPTLINCTFTANSAVHGAGGGIFSGNISSPTITNCILWNDLPDEIYSTESDAVVTYCDVQGGYPAGASNIDADPLFADATYHLSADSPCVDAGSYVAALTEDYEGHPRGYDGTNEPRGDGSDYDIGADEFGLAPPPAAAFSASSTSGNRPLTLDFTDESTGTITSWLWDFGDGSTSTEQNPSHTYYVAGDYVVTLTVSGPGGPDDGATAFIQVDQASVEAGRYKTIVGDIKVLYDKGGCLAWHNLADNTLRIEVWEDDGNLTLTCREDAPLYWDTRCDVYIYAPDVSVKSIILKGRPETQLYVCGQVGYVKNFKLKYGHVGDTISYGPEVGLGSAALDPPKKIVIKDGWSTTAVLGVGYPELRFDPEGAEDEVGIVEMKPKPFEILLDKEDDDAKGRAVAGAEASAETKAAYKFEQGDLKVIYTKPGCEAYYDTDDDILRIEISESDGDLTVKCGEDAYIEWEDYCDIYIDAPTASVNAMNLKGRPETQLHVAGEVASVNKFKLKYGSVGDTDFYGPAVGLHSIYPVIPIKIKILWGWATAPVLGVY